MVAAFVALASIVAIAGLTLYPAVWLYAIGDASVVAERQASDDAAETEGDESEPDA